TKNSEVLREDADRAALDGASPRDYAIAEELLLVHAKVPAAVRDELVHLGEAVLVEQGVDALACGELAGLVLLVDALGTAARGGLRFHSAQAADRGFFTGLGLVGGHDAQGRRTLR